MHATPSRICLVKLGAIGDVVNTLPLVCRLRRAFPRAKLSWVIAPLAHRLVEGHDAVDEFLVLDVSRPSSWPAFLRTLRSRKFDLAIDLQRILKSGLVTRLSGAPRRLGFDKARCKERSWLFTNERIPARQSPGVTVAQYLEFADHLGAPAAEPEWRLPIVPWCQEAPRVALNLGASKPANLWHPDGWASLAHRLVERVPARRIALIGGADDRAAADAVLAQGPPGLLDAVGALSLKETAGLIAASEVFVGCDTGPLHLAVAVRTPVVALFGAADPARTGPFGAADSVIFKGVECSPCRRRECPIDTHPCMTRIGAEEVATRVLALLDAGR